jgi:fluoride ion exporter CrcB/FEX
LLGWLIAPFGAMVRWQLGAIFNGKSWFPIGTLIANVFAVFLISLSDGIFSREYGAFTINYVETKGQFTPGGNWLQKILVFAFCGNLSTVSTWMNELHNIRGTLKKWSYLLISFILS